MKADGSTWKTPVKTLVKEAENEGRVQRTSSLAACTLPFEVSSSPELLPGERRDQDRRPELCFCKVSIHRCRSFNTD